MLPPTCVCGSSSLYLFGLAIKSGKGRRLQCSTYSHCMVRILLLHLNKKTEPSGDDSAFFIYVQEDSNL